MSKNKLIILNAPWDHFSEESGFNIVGLRIKHLLQQRYDIETFSSYRLSYFEKLLTRLNRKLRNEIKNNNWSPYCDFASFFQSSELNKLRAFDYVLLLATENQFCGKFLTNQNLRKKTILFLHQPPSWFKINEIDTEILNDVLAIIVLSNSQKQFFTNRVKTPVLLLKHGVDLKTFSWLSIPKRKEFLIVGQHLRNFEVITETIIKVWEIDNEIVFHFVIPKKYRPTQLYKIASNDNVIFHNNVSVQELVQLYNSSMATFLPLIDSTANNAINESMACGTPVITNNIGGVLDYISTDQGIVLNTPCANVFCEAIINIASEKIVFSGNSIRKFAEDNLDWQKIISDQFLKSILN